MLKQANPYYSYSYRFKIRNLENQKIRHKKEGRTDPRNYYMLFDLVLQMGTRVGSKILDCKILVSCNKINGLGQT